MTSRHQRRSRLGVLGFGSFGRFLVGPLRPYFSIRVWDQKNLEEEARALGVEWVSLSEIADCDIVVPAVPVQALESVLCDLGPQLRPGTLVVDVSSVKVRPLALLERYVPREVEICGTHPMFGPQSGARGIAGLKVVLCPLRTRRVRQLRRFLEDELGLEVIEMAPEAHDREMAYIQGLTHWIARALREINVPNLDLSTVAYRHLLKIEEILREDSHELFLTIARENPFAKEARAELLQRLSELEACIEEDSDESETP